MRKSREKSKQKAEETKKRVRKLREENKHLEGKIDEQKKTKKFLKELFLQQTTTRMDKPTKQQLELIKEDSTDDEEESEHSEVSDSSSEDDSESEDRSQASSKRRRRKWMRVGRFCVNKFICFVMIKALLTYQV